MTTTSEPTEAREVSPLELFYDLVFVFAVSQLSEHLLHDLTWRGAAETLVLLCAVFTVWLLTTFDWSSPNPPVASSPPPQRPRRCCVSTTARR